MNVELEKLINKCRYCLQELTLPEDFAVESEIFYDLMNSQLIDSEKLSIKSCQDCYCEMQKFSDFKKKLLNNQQTLTRLLTKTSLAEIQSSVIDPIKVEFVEPTVFIKEELHDESSDQNETSDLSLDSCRQKLGRFSVQKNNNPQGDQRFPCYQCDEVFLNEAKVKQHAEIVHTPLDENDMEENQIFNQEEKYLEKRAGIYFLSS